MIRQALTGVAMSNPLLTAIRQKLFLSSTLLPLADGLTNIHQAQVVGQLAEGIRDRVQVRLLRYHSANSNTISDRLVEPLAFTDGYATLEAYEPASDTVKIFKTKRIEAIALTDHPAGQYPSNTVQDLFDWTGPCWLPVDLHLSHRAYCLLIEEYPAARPNTYERPGESPFRYGWQGLVRDWRGIGRFVLGLPGEVAVVRSDDFRTYLQKRVTEFIF
ncbi:WYL domain-containing protein [Spirosoma utsteinense]|uniref:DNA-binding transcriptional regulator YafY n=1 Tax=Spirosoma utsteinense TaxID=2585773 RepID=A0ABR6W8M0_9BACT|nr:WYL domain-containing protein [Spirosoma utsteinense]MBC3787237.1 putative DNA-binding transcriptional regulator YafY [Spirosoma utsteinense]MBC3792923.1 putative DNA-binding transcriptional regulator YafY [Spirosoma utsteinense]